MGPGNDRFYTRWILANAVSEGIGLGSTLLLAYLLVGRLEGANPGAMTIVLGALLAVALGTALEGVLVGWAQGLVLATRAPRIRVRDWTVATAVGAGIAWILGMLPSTVIGLLVAEPGAGNGAAGPAVPAAAPAWLMLALAAAMGLVLGPVLALAQWRVLRRVVHRPSRWLAANAAAWAVGMVLVFAGMHRVAWTGGLLGVASGILLACTLAGAAVGAVHGWVLRRMLSEDG